MNEFMANIHFLRPWWLLLLVLLPLAGWMLVRSRRGHAELTRLADPAMLPLLLAPGRRGHVGPLLLLTLCWLLSSLAMAGPAWERLPAPLYAGGEARVVALSLSAHMLATDLQPDRLTRARFKIRDLLEAGSGDQNALIAYAGDAFQVAPLTPDVDTVLNLLGALNPGLMPVPGDATARAIELGVNLLQQAGVHGGEVVLVTSSAGDGAVAAARVALAAGVQVSVLAVGTENGAPVAVAPGEFLADARGNTILAELDAAQLRAVADAGGGVYRTLQTDASDIAALLGNDAGTTRAVDGERSSTDSASTTRWRDRGPWLLLALVPLAALGFRRGWLLLVPLVLLSSPMPTQAGVWDELWYNADQRAARALAADKPERAQELAASPAWQGTAAFKSGDYAQAARAFAQARGTEARYNLGNALAAAGKYQEAIDAYDQALTLDPENADAQANRKAVKEWLQREQEKQQQGNQRKQGAQPGQQQGEQRGQSQQPRAGKGQAGQQPSAPGRAGGEIPSSAERTARRGGEDAADSNNGEDGTDAGDSDVATNAAERQARQAQQAEHALKQRMDRAVQVRAAQAKAEDQQSATDGYVLGNDAGDSTMPGTMQRALDRVPDDPGGLLRRKFLLEHQRRQQGGGQP